MGGAEHSLADIILRLKKSKGFQPILVVPSEGGFADHISAMDVTVERLSSKIIPGKLEKLLFPMRLKRLIKLHEPDIVHLNTKGAIKYLLPSLPGRKFRWVQHVRGNLISDDAKLFHRWAINLSDMRIGISKSTKKSYGLENDPKFRILYNAFDFSLFPSYNPKDSVLLKEDLGIPPGGKVILNVGRFAPIKGQKLLIEALEYLKRDDMYIVFCGESIFGNASEESYGRELKAKGEDMRRVRFAGWRDDLQRFYGMADLYVQTSETEAFGRTLIESVYYKTPVLAPPLGAMEELILAGQIGLFYKRDPRSLAESILKHFSEPVPEGELERRKKEVEKRYTLDKYIHSLTEIYDKL